MKEKRLLLLLLLVFISCSRENKTTSNNNWNNQITTKLNKTDSLIFKQAELKKNINFPFMSEESNICLRDIFAYNFQTLLRKIIGTGDVYIRYDNEKEAVFNNMFCKFIKKKKQFYKSINI